MTSTRPYLLRAIYEWLVDNHLTPHLLVETSDERVSVPEKFVEDGKIVLNVAPSAVRDLELGNEFVSFSARFAGVAHQIFVPVASVQAIYARENGQGMVLSEMASAHEAADSGASAELDTGREQSSATTPSAASDKPNPRPPHLTIVK